MVIFFLSQAEALEIHANQIELYGGSLGIRDPGLLEAAIAQPQAQFGGEFLHHFPYEMAAAYLFHIVNNHPFIDGNKRVGAVAAIVFLVLNGYELNVSDDLLEKTVLEVASGKLKKKSLARFFENHSTLVREKKDETD